MSLGAVPLLLIPGLGWGALQVCALVCSWDYGEGRHGGKNHDGEAATQPRAANPFLHLASPSPPSSPLLVLHLNLASACKVGAPQL